jgi:hypothetical protein
MRSLSIPGALLKQLVLNANNQKEEKDNIKVSTPPSNKKGGELR